MNNMKIKQMIDAIRNEYQDAIIKVDHLIGADSYYIIVLNEQYFEDGLFIKYCYDIIEDYGWSEGFDNILLICDPKYNFVNEIIFSEQKELCS